MRDQINEELVARYATDLLYEANGLGFYDGQRLSTLVSLQHHGGATRLLDITRNLFVALWFAGGASSDDVDGVIHHIQIDPGRVYYNYELNNWDSIVDARHAGQPFAARSARISACRAAIRLSSSLIRSVYRPQHIERSARSTFSNRAPTEQNWLFGIKGVGGV